MRTVYQKTLDVVWRIFAVSLIVWIAVFQEIEINDTFAVAIGFALLLLAVGGLFLRSRVESENDRTHIPSSAGAEDTALDTVGPLKTSLLLVLIAFPIVLVVLWLLS